MDVEDKQGKTFRVVLIKPSHYDDNGYVIRWHRSIVPSNTLAVIYGLVQDLIERKVLGDDVDIRLDGYDETNTKIPLKQIIRDIKSSDGGGFVGFVGVQSNQFPRALDMAKELRAAHIQVSIGGFHVSGCGAMLKESPPDIQQAKDLGISLFVGEAEGRMDELFRDAYAGRLKPEYNYLSDLPAIESAPPPFLPASMLSRSIGSFASFDAGRGCPFLCSFCTIINVQGRKSRQRSADDVEHIVRTNWEQGISFFFITDDNLARNQNWESIFDRLIHMREQEGINIAVTIQVDTMAHRIPNFIDKAGRAGVGRVFIGMESINPDTLKAAGKRQNRISEYREMLQAWRKARVIICAGFIIGFPADTPESIAEDIETIKRELPIDFLQLSYLTPLPGSADHKQLYEGGARLDPDMNKYDLNHVCAAHPTMSGEVWQAAYEAAWRSFYSKEHIETIFRRAHADNTGLNRILFLMLWFYTCTKVEGLHPFDAGIFRRKSRSERRPELPVESPFVFYPKRLAEVLHSQGMLLFLKWKWGRFCKQLEADPQAANYSDLSLAPVESQKPARSERRAQHRQIVIKTEEPATVVDCT